ncbi:MAG: TetR/AcrR family transcriptional regulator [Pseudomonadota bacterium]
MGQSTSDRILDAAEARLRLTGYNGFSFRDLAEDIGIKSASVHHHFPTKEALAIRLAESYTERFMTALETAPTGPARIGAYRELFRDSLKDGGKMCLCGMLGAEISGLPASVTAKAKDFFEAITTDLEANLKDHADPRGKALAVLARLEGALILGRTYADLAVFDQAVADL